MVDERGFRESCHVLVRSELGGADLTLTRNASTHSIFPIRAQHIRGRAQAGDNTHPPRDGPPQGAGGEMTKALLGGVLVVMLANLVPVFAHHSPAAFDRT